jgi:hypothetical protein
MLFEPLFERFACGTPLSVMTRAVLENALQPDPLDELFERLAVTQYTRALLFSTVVETMALVQSGNNHCPDWAGDHRIDSERIVQAFLEGAG